MPFEMYNIDKGFDGHVHTYMCGHAKGTMEEYVQAALSKGLHTICFLEHLEVGIQNVERSWLTQRDFQRYFEQGSSLRKKYKNQIKILLGVEAGYNPEAQQLFLQSLAGYPWDKIGLSNHFIKIGNEHLNVLSRKKHSLMKLLEHGPQKVAHIYYSSILEALQVMEKCDVVCHLDAVLRHHPAMEATDSHWKLVEEILDTMKERDTALELNTSGFPLKKRPYPSKKIIVAAINKGVRLQVGSDAHAPVQVGRYLTRLEQYLSQEIAL